MSELTGRLLNVAKAYLNAAKDRLDTIDAQAQDELSRALSHDDVAISTPTSASSDPMERARVKIAAAQNAVIHQEIAPTTFASTPTPSLNNDPISTAYRILGIPFGADYAAVQAAVERLRERCAPLKFPEGSPERAEAETILGKVEQAHQLLRASLDAGTGRFDKLEI